MLALQYPVGSYYVTQPSAKLRLATNVDGLCNSTTYTSSAHFSSARTYEDAVKELERKEWVEELKRISKEESETLKFYPNPASNSINLEYIVPYSGYVKIAIFDFIGKEISILRYIPYLEKGFYKEEFELKNIQKGIYHLSIEMNGNRQIQKLVIN